MSRRLSGAERIRYDKGPTGMFFIVPMRDGKRVSLSEARDLVDDDIQGACWSYAEAEYWISEMINENQDLYEPGGDRHGITYEIVADD